MAMTEVLAELSSAVRPTTRREFNAMGRQGWFEDEQVELIDGVIVRMAAEGGPHLRVVMWLNNHLAKGLGEEGMVGVSHPYEVDDWSQPQPDLAVVRSDVFARLGDAVRAAELVIEVALSSRRRDLGVKVRLYAQAAVPEYWVVDLVNRRLVIHTDPAGDRYASVRTLDDTAVATAVGVDVPLTALFALADDR